ncbi:putative reverse transcriptase zinc-binding domain-containing protein [Helianthus debilis subsp. tardiflorus]
MTRNKVILTGCSRPVTKVSVFMWRAVLDRIPSLSALQARNAFNGDVSCSMCGDEVESSYHLLCACRVASEVWYYISRKAKEVLCGIMHVASWCIWKARNNKRFSNIHVKPVEIFQDVKSFGFLWYRSHSKDRNLCWNKWCNFEFV